MAKEKVSVVFDRRKKAEQAGVGYVEVQIYLSRSERKYICLGKCTPDVRCQIKVHNCKYSYLL